MFEKSPQVILDESSHSSHTPEFTKKLILTMCLPANELPELPEHTRSSVVSYLHIYVMQSLSQTNRQGIIQYYLSLISL